MEVALCGTDWRALRRLVRRAPRLGRELRAGYGRKTKDGAFLTDLQQRGLIAPVVMMEPGDQLHAKEPKPFRMWWRLTDAGVFAAEYGCYTANDTGLADAEQKELHGEA
jgi:hypothetical protein